jgi:hypothetical protein
MSTLPAGFFITSINGQRCTAVPRAATTLIGSVATEAAAQPPTTTPTTTATTAAAAATSILLPATSATGNVVNTVVASTQVSSPVVVIASTPTLSLTTSSITPAAASSFIALPASKGTTPTVSSSTEIPLAQSEVSSSFPFSSSTTPVFTILNSGGGFTSSRTSASLLATTTAISADTTASAGVAATSKPSPAPVVGGVLGSMSLIALIAFLFWFLRRRRARRDSLLTPLGTGQRSSFYEPDPVSTKKGSKWKYELSYQTDRLRTAGADLKESILGLGAALKSRVAGDRSATPSVNLNRGNSQFLDGPIPQHSRNNSAASGHIGNATFKEKASDFLERVGDKVNFGNWRLRRKLSETPDPFTRAMSEKSKAPDFSRIEGMEDLQQQAERRRASLSGTGSLGLDFGATADPFADPTKAAPKTTAYTNPFADPTNPFVDPPVRPQASVPKANTYIADIRRSRGQSIDATTTANNASNTASLYRPPSTSRYPSTIAPSRDSYRDTVFSSFSTNVRKGKGRSDPFDLERPELWRPRTESKDMYPPPLNSARMANGNTNAPNAKAQNILGMEVGGQPGKRVVTYDSSKYSSGVSGISEWGEPGPDVAPGSLSKEGILGNGMDIYAQQQAGGYDSGAVLRSTSNASSKNGVGKAM